jgi:hypothetical protein
VTNASVLEKAKERYSFWEKEDRKQEETRQKDICELFIEVTLNAIMGSKTS